MPDHSRAPLAVRARPLADLPLEALLEGTPNLARLWALALVRARPLHAVGEIRFEQLALEAPALCGQLLRSLGSDGELETLTADESERARGGSNPALRLGVLAGAQNAAQVVAAVEALRGVIWEALQAELAAIEPDASQARRLIDACDRLAFACSALLPAALTALEMRASAQEASATTAEESALDAGHGGIPARHTKISIVDERRVDREPRSMSPAPQRVTAPELIGIGEIEVRDERGEEGPAAWIGSIGRQLRRFEEDRVPFAVLLLHLSHGPAVTAVSGPLERALTSILPESGGGSLTRERPGRYWLLAPRTDRGAADGLVQRLGAAISDVGRAHEVEVAVAIGTAVCPQDGVQASALAAHADIGLYAARSRSRVADLAAVPTDGRD